MKVCNLRLYFNYIVLALSNEQVTQFIISKGTLSRPKECPNLLWDIMQKCWDWYPMKRPTCFEIIDMLQVKYVLET